MKSAEALKLSFLRHGNTTPFIVASLLYCFFLAIPFEIFLLTQAFEETTEGAEEIYLSPAFGLTEEGLEFIVRLALFSAVISFGALGSAISVITRARNGEDIVPGITPRELISVQTVGAVFALILSLMFMGELVGGSMFPNWDPFYTIIYAPAAFAKLLVWSFIAGFFERFVPNILQNLSSRAEKRVQDAEEARALDAENRV